MRRSFFTPEEIFSRAEGLAAPRTGLIGPAQELALRSGNPELCVFGVSVSNPNQLAGRIAALDPGNALSGAGSSLDRTWARAKAYCEALERYSNYVPPRAEFVVASRAELGADALDLELFPRCSAAEYASPRNSLVPPSNQARMRWVQGRSLITGRPCWVPAIAAYLGLEYDYPGEAFMLPISTGSALAASYEQALVSAICEVVERDALMLTWLHQLPLPRIDVAEFHEPGFEQRVRRVVAAGIEQIFFDATTDLGVATLYALQLAPHGDVAALVMSATRTNPLSIFSKIIDESSSSRFAIEQLLRQPLPFDPQDFGTFRRLTDGAAYYADPRRLEAFDFLLGHDRWRDLGELPALDDPDPAVELDRLVGIFRRRDLELVAVDLTLPSVGEAGFRAVKVVAPQLLPLATDHNCRFLDTPRLYEAPARMGYEARRPDQLNPWPQPFA